MVKRSTWEGQTVVYQYGTPHWADLDEQGIHQIRLAHDLRNALVEIEKDHAAAVATIWAEHPEVTEAQQAVDEAATQVDGLVERAKSERQKFRSTKPSDETASALKVARKRRRETKERLRDVKSQAHESMKPKFQATGAERKGRIKALYSDFVQTRGLFWATFNDVVASHDTAVKRVTEARKQGRKAELRFHRWDGTGTISVQLQRGSGHPVRTPELIASGTGPWRNVVTLTPWRDPSQGKPRGKSRHGDIRFTLGKGRHATLPILVDRFLPADADITDVRVTRKQVGPRHRLFVSATVRLGAPARAETGKSVAIRIHPVSDHEGGAVVARASTDGVWPEVPDGDLADVLVTGEQEADVTIPTAWRKVYARSASIRSVRDDRLEAIRAEVVEALVDPDLAARVGVGPTDVSKWRSQRRFVVLARNWPAEHPLADTLEQWRSRDKHLWDFEANERDQIMQRRKEAYRRVADWLCRDTVQIVLDARPLQRHRPDVSTEDTYAQRGSRAMSVFLAPGELRQCIETAAARRGIEVVRVAKEKG